MELSSIEITENEYLIKLNREEYDLSFINQLYKRIQSEGFFSSFGSTDDDIISRRANGERVSYFSHLDDK